MRKEGQRFTVFFFRSTVNNWPSLLTAWMGGKLQTNGWKNYEHNPQWGLLVDQLWVK